ncbi:MAG: hypothetical protein RMK65_01535 [Anaerolineae bacterium]|nr:hypothetical protein [Anaerolineae bacterium]MCX8066761.1 hypothetical protein [Anaerolineae bacterium]MDW7990826.1 hypothetical protein [Anaerolineae bacterium]
MHRERLLWLILLLLAATLRLADLGAAPLTSAEAVGALAAYRAAHGGGIPPEAREIPPLLFHAHVLLFALFHGSDGLARMVSALCGVGLTLTPLLLRRYLGPWGAAGSGLLLALSPTLLALSRTIDGAIPAALGVMLLVGAVARYLDSWRSAWISLGGVGLALALTAGPTAWGLLLGLALALAAGLWVWREQAVWIWPMIRPALGRALTAFALGLFAFGTGLGLHPAGLAATGEQFVRWLFPEAGHTLNFVLQVLSEPLILLTGVAGAALALSRRHGMGLLWLFWAAVGIVEALLIPAPASPVLWLVPLAGLGGLAVEELARALQKSARGAPGWVYGALSLVLWIHSGLVLARYSRYAQPADLFLLGISLALQVLLILLFSIALAVPEGDEPPEEATRRALLFVLYRSGLVVGIVLLAVTFAAGWRVARVCPGEPTCAPGAVPAPVARDLRWLVAEAERILTQTPARGEEGCRLRLVDSNPAVVWALRDLRSRFCPTESLSENRPTQAKSPVGTSHSEPNAFASGERPALIVAPAGIPVPEGYYGTPFTLRRAWTLPRTSYEWTRWWLYRTPLSPLPPAEQVVLWVREDLKLGQNQ